MKILVMLERYRSRLLALERRAPLTAETYNAEVRHLLEWIEYNNLDVETIDGAGISDYLDYRRVEDELDSRSIAKAISALRSFFRFMIDEQLREDNPVLILETPRRSMHLPSVLSRESVEKILETVNIDTPIGLRDRTIIELIYSAGLRVSEAVTLNVQDIFFEKGIARIRGKGNKERLVPFGEESEKWLRLYLHDSRPKLAGAVRSPALFVGRTGKRLSRKGIWKNYSAVTGLAGASSKLHNLRHSYATELLAGGADLRSVQELLGHADLTTTQIYTHVDVSLLRENHRRFMPKLREYTE
ncbi:MAG: tyrosine recombinase [Treponema sp.]|jgi:integrase/recombinase XerD|nr:tyrosine recombinase [Treponema sp.]